MINKIKTLLNQMVNDRIERSKEASTEGEKHARDICLIKSIATQIEKMEKEHKPWRGRLRSLFRKGMGG